MGGVGSRVCAGGDVVLSEGVGGRAGVVWTGESAVGAVSCGDGVVVGVCSSVGGSSCVGLIIA